MKKPVKPESVYYTPYLQDRADMRQRRANRTSSKRKLVWIVAWLVLVAIFGGLV